MPGFLDRVLGLSALSASAERNPDDERWWRGGGSGSREYWGGFTAGSYAGPRVGADDVLGVSYFHVGTMIWAETMGTLPLRFYRMLPDGRRELVHGHPVQRKLAADYGTPPNAWQTGAEWRSLVTAHQTLWGLGLSEVAYGDDGIELLPIDPDWIIDIDTLRNRTKRYRIAEPGFPERTLLAEEAFALNGWSTNARIPESILKRAKEAVGKWLAQQQFGASYYRRGASPSLIFTTPGKMSPVARKNFEDKLQRRAAGAGNAMRTLVLEEDIAVKEIGHTARNAQATEALEAQSLELVRWMGIPAHFFELGNLPYNSREQAALHWVTNFVRPRAVRWQGAIQQSLIPEEDIVCELDTKVLTWGTLADRIDALSKGVMGGLMSENEGREDLGLNPVPGMDEPRRSANMDRGGDPKGTRQEPEEARARAFAEQRAEAIARKGAERLMRRELEGVRKLAAKHAGDGDAFLEAAGEFYAHHAEVVADSLAIEHAAALALAEKHRRALVEIGMEAAKAWEAGGVGELVAAALKEDAS